MNALQRFGHLGRVALNWWVAELSASAQWLFRAIAPRAAKSTRLSVRDNALHIENLDRAYPLNECLETTETPPEIVSLLESGDRAVVTLSAEWIFETSFPLPVASLPYLESALTLHWPKVWPLPVASIRTDHQVRESPDNKHILISAAAVRQDELSPVLEILGRWGFRVTAVHAASEGRDWHFKNVVSSGSRALGVWDRRLGFLSLALVVLLLATVGIESARSAHSISVAESIVREPARRAMSARQHLFGSIEPLDDLTRLEATRGAAQILADLSSALPADSWLTTLELRKGHVRMVGVSSDVSAAVRHLSSLPMWTRVELHSATSLGVGTGQDRFEVTAELRRD